MPVSSVTSKGQTTIPKEVREFLELEVHSAILDTVENGRVYMARAPRNIIELKGSVKSDKRFDLKQARRSYRKYVARRLPKPS
ncbi:MAG: AbrB family transcriptional regulator [Acidobacteria bacterium]|nr:AbrB family transcriptional regulator [Acidobacteriota bacterium]